MEGINILQYTRWYPLSIFGLTGPLWGIHKETMIATWVVLFILGIITLLARRALKAKRTSIAYTMVTAPIKVFMNLCTQSLGSFKFSHFSFLASLFLFILTCSTLHAYIPWLEEPTSDLNTAFALGFCSFCYVQGSALISHGVGGYLRELCQPLFIFFPLHITGKLATIVSISFRLFGNIFGGAIITQIAHSMAIGSLAYELAFLLSGLNLMITAFFGIFEGIIQAFVFFMLSLTYLSMALQHPSQGPDHS